MLDQKVAELLNVQVNKEFYSAYLYLDFSIYYDEIGLDGFSNWYKVEVLEFGLEHERYVTGLIHNIYEAAQAAKDFRTTQFLDWFVKEQGEEEKNAEDMIKKMKLFGDDAKGLYMLNSEMAARVYSAPSLVL